MDECESLIPIDITTIMSCRCYSEYWKTIKMSTPLYVQFDYSIEKTFSYRKYFYHQNLLYHFCINCFFDIVLSIPMNIIEDENLRGYMGCIRYKTMLLDDCCPMCVNYIIKYYSAMFFTTI